MSRRSQNKGAGFERLVVKAILKAFPEFGPEDCYRRPKSGGHPFAGKGDLIISPRLLKRFPYGVECKHHNHWKPGNFFQPTAEERGWLRQAQEAAEGRTTPLLVVRGNYTDVFCAVPTTRAPSAVVNRIPALHFVIRGQPWVQLWFQDFLAEVC